MKVYVFLANGFEELEVAYPVSILRAAGFDVVTVSIMGTEKVIGSHGISIIADATYGEINAFDADAIILPGGQPGTDNLHEFEQLRKVILHYGRNKVVAAICAAPLILGEIGLLEGKTAICYPGYEFALKGAKISNLKVVTDGNIITAIGPGVAKEFAFAIVKRLGTIEQYDKIGKLYN